MTSYCLIYDATPLCGISTFLPLFFFFQRNLNNRCEKHPCNLFSFKPWRFESSHFGRLVLVFRKSENISGPIHLLFDVNDK